MKPKFNDKSVNRPGKRSADRFLSEKEIEDAKKNEPDWMRDPSLLVRKPPGGRA